MYEVQIDTGIVVCDWTTSGTLPTHAIVVVYVDDLPYYHVPF